MVDSVQEALRQLFSASREPAPEHAEAPCEVDVAEEASPRSFLVSRGPDSSPSTAACHRRGTAFEEDDDGLLASISRLLGLDRAEAASGEEAETSTEEEDEEEEEAGKPGQQSAGQQWQRQRWDSRRCSVGRPRPSVPAARSSAPAAGAGAPAAAAPLWVCQHGAKDGRPRPSAASPPTAVGGPAPAAARLWICRHGTKEGRLDRESNWQLLLTPTGVAEVEAAAGRLAAQRGAGLAGPRRVVCSPFPRCVVTAGIYARVLSLPCLCVEPGLCEVLTPDKGARGLAGPRPAWREAELLGLLAASGAGGVELDAGYAPAVQPEELCSVASEADRSEVDARVRVLAACVAAGTFDGDLLVTHGSPAYRLVRALTAERCFAEPPMGSVIELVACPGSGGSWGRVESFECPGGSSSHA